VTLTIDIPPDVAARLADRARREGRAVDDLAVDLLGESLQDDTDAAALDTWLRGPVTATLDKIDAGNGRFHTVIEAERYLAERRTGTPATC
jgi:hypothetical protein